MSWYTQPPRYAAAIFHFYKVIGVFPFQLVTNNYGKIKACESKFFRLLSIVLAVVFYTYFPLIQLKRISSYENTYSDNLVKITTRLEPLFLYIKIVSFYYIILFKYKTYMNIFNKIVIFYDIINYFDKKANIFKILFIKIFIHDAIVNIILVYFDSEFYFSDISLIKVFENIVDIYVIVLLCNVGNIFITFLLSSASMIKEINNLVKKWLKSTESTNYAFKKTLIYRIECLCILQTHIRVIVEEIFIFFGFSILLNIVEVFFSLLAEVSIFLNF